MQRFLALMQNYGKYTEGYAKLVAPLRRLEKKICWSKDDMAPGKPEHDLFLQIKEWLGNVPECAHGQISQAGVQNAWDVCGEGVAARGEAGRAARVQR